MPWSQTRAQTQRIQAEMEMNMAASCAPIAQEPIELEYEKLMDELREIDAEIKMAWEKEAEAKEVLQKATSRRMQLQKISEIKANAIRALEAERPDHQDWTETEAALDAGLELEISNDTAAAAGLDNA